MAPVVQNLHGPYGLTQVNIINVWAEPGIEPLHATISLGLIDRGPTSNPRREIAVYDASSQLVARAVMPWEEPPEVQRQAAQWLLDLACTRMGMAGEEVSFSAGFQITYRGE